MSFGVDVDGDWSTPWPPARPQPWWNQRYDDARRAGNHLLPWIARRLRGQSSGDTVQPKRPELRPL